MKDTSGKLRGVLTADFDLNALSDFVSGLSVSEHSRVFLFTSDEILLAHPDRRGGIWRTRDRKTPHARGRRRSAR